MSILIALIDNEVTDHLEIKERKQFDIATNLGAKLRKSIITNGVEAWTLRPSKT